MLLLGGFDALEPRLIVCPLLPLPIDTTSSFIERATLVDKYLVYPNPAKQMYL